MDVPTFHRTFPEFREVSPEYVQPCIDRAVRWVAPDVWGDMTDDGIAYKAAHFLAISPFGGGTRLVAKDGTTTYGKLFDEMLSTVTSGACSVAGGF